MVLLEQALQRLEQSGVSIKAQSSLYETAPWGVDEQPAYLNQVLEVATDQTPLQLLNLILEIEKALGRERKVKWAARTLDIDILYFDDKVVTSPELTLPHPRLHERRFVLVPLCEIAPLLEHPVLKKNNLQLLEECPDQLQVYLLNE